MLMSKIRSVLNLSIILISAHLQFDDWLGPKTEIETTTNWIRTESEQKPTTRFKTPGKKIPRPKFLPQRGHAEIKPLTLPWNIWALTEGWIGSSYSRFGSFISTRYPTPPAQYLRTASFRSAWWRRTRYFAHVMVCAKVNVCYVTKVSLCFS